MRFQPANSADLDAYSLRLELLAKDCAHLAVPLLRAACDRAAKGAIGLPYVKAILDAARDIVEERQRVRRDATPGHTQATGREEKLAELSRQYNRENALKGIPNRWTEKMEQFSLVEPGEKRRTDADGAVFWP